MLSSMVGASNMGTVMTLTNSIIGVSVLAMPFCFKQCGILLSVVMLVISSLVSRLACHFLLKAAQMARRRNFEFLAFQTFGPMGKFVVELFIIGFLMGTCVAFFVIMGDLGPVIIAKTLNIGDSSALRPSVLIGVGLFVVIPLGLLRNVDSLSNICTASVVFYICFVLKVVVESLPHLLEGDWVNHVHYWKPSGVLQCIPIFSMALFCQTQLFEIYESIPNASLEQMNELIRKAVNICTCVYISVGFFGYVAFCTQNFSGNVLLSFTPSLVSDVITVGFVMSIAVSFPLTIFPCRASIYSLLFRRAQMSHHDGITSHIPEARFKCITLFVVSFALAVGLLVPSIELVLGLVGSTIGVLICIMFPAVAFIRINTKSSYDRLLAQVVLFVGVLILVLGTYATLYASTETVITSQAQQDSRPVVDQPEVPHIVDVNLQMNKNKPPDPPVLAKEEQGPPVVPSVAQDVAKAVEKLMVPEVESKNVRQEPPVPVEPVAVPAEPAVKSVEEVAVSVDLAAAPADLAAVPAQVTKVPALADKAPTPSPDEKVAMVVESKATVEQVIHQDAIKKEEEALAEAAAGVGGGREVQEPNKQQVELLLKLEQHKEEQKQLLQEQQEILQQLNRHKEDLERSRHKTSRPPVAAPQKPTPAPAVAVSNPPRTGRLNKPADMILAAQSQVLPGLPSQLKTQDKSSVAKPQSIIPLPIAVQDNSKLFNKALQQVAENHLSKENISGGTGQVESKIVHPKVTQSVIVMEELKAKENVAQRDILSNVGPSRERDKRDVEQWVADDVASKNASGDQSERHCDVGQKLFAAKNVVAVSTASHEVVLPKIEGTDVTFEKKINSDSISSQPSSVRKNMTVDIKVLQHSHNATSSRITDKKMADKIANESATESIIKMASYLSVQSFDDTIGSLGKGISKAGEWKHLETLVKPMSRDLKSVAAQKFHDVVHSPKLSEIFSNSKTVNSTASQKLITDSAVITQKSINDLNSDQSKFSETLAVMTEQTTLNRNVDLLKKSGVELKPLTRDLKSVPAQKTNGGIVGVSEITKNSTESDDPESDSFLRSAATTHS